MNRKLISKAFSNIDDAFIAETLSPPAAQMDRAPERTIQMSRYEPKKTKVQRLEATVAELRAKVRQLEADKKNLIVQLVDYEETKAENERLRRQSLKGVNHEE